jgi:hypothetical protein
MQSLKTVLGLRRLVDACRRSAEGSVHIGLWWISHPATSFSPGTVVFPCQHHSTNAPFLLYLSNTLIRSTRGQTLVTFKQSSALG